MATVSIAIANAILPFEELVAQLAPFIAQYITLGQLIQPVDQFLADNLRLIESRHFD